MFGALFVVAMLFVPQAGPAASLPDTPQGRHLQAYLDAFNSRDEKKFLAMLEKHLEPGVLKRRPLEEQAKLFQRMRGDFGTLKVSKVVNSSLERIQLEIPDQQGTVATFTFGFEASAPFSITSIAVEIDRKPLIPGR